MMDPNNLHGVVGLDELDDLGNLFEFGDIGVDLNNINDLGSYGEQLERQDGMGSDTLFQDRNKAMQIPGSTAQDFGNGVHYAVMQDTESQHMHGRNGRMFLPNAYISDPVNHLSTHTTTYNSYPQDLNLAHSIGYLPNQHVPPTPNSFEMHGETAHFLQQQQSTDPQQRAMLEKRYQPRRDDAITFTPMVSPAGTPQYNLLPEYTTPGAYFSPLTSPMLLAQSQQQSQYHSHTSQGYQPGASTAPSSNTISPIDPNIDIDMLDAIVLPESAGPKPRKPRRKVATAKTPSAASKVRQSPAQNAQKRKSVPLDTSASHTGTEAFLQRSVTSQPSLAGLQLPCQPGSSSDSISPEPLSELMGPPPRPGSSVHTSPALISQNQHATRSQTAGPAATPKSILTMRGNQQSIDAAYQIDSSAASPDGLEDLSLPEAAATQRRRKPSLAQIDTQLAPTQQDESTSRTSARKTPKLGPTSTPASTRVESASDSPIVPESPMAASTPAGILNDKKEGKPGRGAKKRGSVSANSSKLVSPALVPKISPSIKPLLPEGTSLNTATQAMMLASKSNYQNLLEGNHLPGVTYPESLSTGLTSKRTSHKVAEQGRRNRINEALKEMQALIPSSTRSKSGSNDMENDMNGDGIDFDDSRGMDAQSKEDALTKSNSSKAATVELANEYIKKIQKEHATQHADLWRLKLENEELKKRLGQQSASPADSASSAVESFSTSSQ